MKTKTYLKRGLSTLVVLVFAYVLAFPNGVPLARAAALTTVKDTLSTVTTGIGANHTFVFTTPTGVGAGETITITFPASFASGLNSVDFADMDLVDDSTDITLGASASGATWGATVATRTVTFTSASGTIGAASVITVRIGTHAVTGVTGDTQITNPAAADNLVISVTAGTSDSGTLAISIIADSSVNVTATVASQLSFSISDVAIGFGPLDVANERYATSDALGAGTDSADAFTMSVATNGAGGYAITYNGPTLTSLGGPTISAAAFTGDADGTNGAEQFAMSAAVNSGNGSIASGYAHTGPDWKFVASTTDQIASYGTPTGTSVIGVRFISNIAATTESGSYSTDITYVATGTF